MTHTEIITEMLQEMPRIDRITVEKALHELAEKYAASARKTETMAENDDKVLTKHKDYWLELAGRSKKQSQLILALAGMFDQ